MAEKIYYWFLLVLALAMLAVSVVGYLGAAKHRDAFEMVCASKSGTVIQGNGKLLCLRTASLIPM